MKKTVLLLVIILCVPVLVSAQHPAVDKGMNLIGGSAGFTSSGGDLFENTDGDKETNLHLNPSFLYFLKPGLGVGGSISYNRNSQGESSSSSFGFGPKVSYFLNNGPGGMIPYGSASFMLSSNSYEHNQYSSKYSQNYFMLEAGLMHMLSDNVGITAGVFYKNVCYSYKDSDSDAIQGNVFGLLFGISTFMECLLF